MKQNWSISRKRERRTGSVVTTSGLSFISTCPQHITQPSQPPPPRLLVYFSQLSEFSFARLILYTKDTLLSNCPGRAMTHKFHILVPSPPFLLLHLAPSSWLLLVTCRVTASVRKPLQLSCLLCRRKAADHCVLFIGNCPALSLCGS